MNAWINEMMGHGRLDISLSNVSMLVPDGRGLGLAATAVAFCVVAACQEVWFNDRQDR